MAKKKAESKSNSKSTAVSPIAVAMLVIGLAIGFVATYAFYAEDLSVANQVYAAMGSDYTAKGGTTALRPTLTQVRAFVGGISTVQQKPYSVSFYFRPNEAGLKYSSLDLMNAVQLIGLRYNDVKKNYDYVLLARPSGTAIDYDYSVLCDPTMYYLDFSNKFYVGTRTLSSTCTTDRSLVTTQEVSPIPLYSQPSGLKFTVMIVGSPGDYYSLGDYMKQNSLSYSPKLIVVEKDSSSSAQVNFTVMNTATNSNVVLLDPFNLRAYYKQNGAWTHQNLAGGSSAGGITSGVIATLTPGTA